VLKIALAYCLKRSFNDSTVITGPVVVTKQAYYNQIKSQLRDLVTVLFIVIYSTKTSTVAESWCILRIGGIVFTEGCLKKCLLQCQIFHQNS
jgi:hypothetical protein